MYTHVHMYASGWERKFSLGGQALLGLFKNVLGVLVLSYLSYFSWLVSGVFWVGFGFTWLDFVFISGFF